MADNFLRETPMTGTPDPSNTGLYPSDNDLVGHYAPKGYVEPTAHSVPRQRRNHKWWIIGGVLATLVVIGAVLGGVLGTQLNKKSGSKNSEENKTTSTGASGSATGTSASASPTQTAQLATGTDGSTIKMDSGVEFTYSNKFGGSWAVDPSNPYNTSGQAQSFTPPLTEPWVWGTDTIRGVNVGGWLVTEPFIVPALYEPYQNSTPQAVDEYTLSQALGADLATKMEEHYATFITEKDFADIAGAGLNWVRVPVGFWAIETQDGEPFLEGVSWKYFTKAVEWARKYGLRILLDFHALPGSQNGWNHSGRSGDLNWMRGTMGLANAQRSLEHIRSMVQYISQPGIKEVVPMLGLVNEVPMTDGLPSYVFQENAGSFYYQAYDMVRKITGFGADNGPILAYHDGFLDIADWAGFLNGADRLALDEHLYLAFGDGNQNDNFEGRISTACSWGGGTNSTQRDLGVVIGGEWSIAMGDCGKWLNGVGNGNSYNDMFNTTGGCTPLEEWFKWDDAYKNNLLRYTSAQMDAIQNWFFWTWRIGNSTELGYPPSPMWHYQLGLQQGWIPSDPRSAGGFCKRNNLCQGCYEFDGNYPASATGGVAAPTIAADQMDKYAAWPPTTLGPSFPSSQVALLPTLTRTGTPITLATPSPSVTGAGNGWADSADTAGAYTTVAGCQYAGAYMGTDIPVPTAVCTGA